MRKGTIDANSREGVSRSRNAPISPPAIDGAPSNSIQRRLSPSSRRKPAIAPSEPGQSATVQVTLARIGSIPIHTSVGKATRVPPPAIEFIIPATNAAMKTTGTCPRVTVAQ